jgi:hypothetical protein
VGLTVEELRALVRNALRAELDVQPKELDEILTRGRRRLFSISIPTLSRVT